MDGVTSAASVIATADHVVSFHGSNSGLQVGVNNGPINADFHLLPPSLDKLPCAHGAVSGSYADQYHEECLEGTRTDILHKISEWAFSPHERSIFWLQGMAGTGKSTISRTVAKSLKQTNHLGASFFFKRGEEDRGNAKMIFPTLTKQLMLGVSGLRSGVQKALDQDPEIATKSLKEQFEKLLLQPLLNLDQLGRHPQTAVIVIDALDECDHDQDIRSIIRLLPALQRAKAIRIRIFLTSRPELPISLGFSEVADHEYYNLSLHEISEEVTKHDIHLFLQDRFAKIKHDRNISEDWPGDDIIQELVTMSVPLFISAATVCRYIEKSKLEPKSRLSDLLANQTKYVSRMDKTYLPILMRLLQDQESDELEQQQLLQEFQQIVGVIILLAVPLSINSLSLFLGIRADQISNRLDSFRSVLSIARDRDQPVRILHLSFRDFLVRSGTKFHVDEPIKHKDITQFCLRAMHSHLQKDICNLGSPGTRRADINPQHIRQSLPLHVQYSCRYWIHHLKQSRALSSEIKQWRLFLQKHFLHWVEAMSLLGLLSEVVNMLDILRTVIPGDDDSVMADFLHDAKRFVLKNRQIADEAPLQIYCSGLIFAPRTAIIRTEFKPDLPNWLCQFPQVNETWNAELQTLEGHSGAVRSVAFSPDGLLLASGSEDRTVRLWDPATGALQQTLEGHLSVIQSVVFSPDGRLLASGSDDCTVRVWDAETGALQQTLEGHSGTIYSVASSPDGRLLVSGSHDQTVRLWDTASGALHKTLEGHLDLVRSVAFSPNGCLIASGSHDQTVRLWNTASGSLHQTLEGHSYSIRQVAFSPNGRLLASGSHDKTIRLWDTTTGVLQQTLKDDSSAIYSVAFSPDCQLIVSGSNDQTVQFWDIATGTMQRSFTGHSGIVYSVAFSPDGQLIVSGSNDQTVRLWDTATTAIQQTPRSHSSAVHLMAFSPDGRQLISGSYDQTVRLWDVATSVLQQTWKGYLELFSSVVFSSDDQLLVPGFNDQKIQYWDPVTGDVNQILEGHLDLVQFVALSANSRPLASGPEDHLQTVQLWDMGRVTPQYNIENQSCSVRSVAFSPDSRLLASGSQDRIVRIWDLATGLLNQTLEGHSGSVQSVAFSLDSRLILSGSNDHTIRLWDTVTGALQQTLKGHLSTVWSVTFSPDSRLLASGSSDHTIRLWDTVTGVLQQTLKGHLSAVQSVTFSPDGRLLASGSYDQTIRLWDTMTGVLEHILEGHSYSVRSVAFSPDGQLLASGSNDGTVRLWNVETRILQQILEGHSGSVWSVDFSPDGRLLAAGSHDKKIQLWDTATGALHQTLEGHSSAVQSVAFSSDNKLLASGSFDDTVRFWDPITGALQDTWTVKWRITTLKYSQKSPYLNAKLRSLDVHPGRDSHLSNPDNVKLEILIEQGQWITLNGEKILWLPAEFRPSSSVIKGSKLALGHASGKVSFIEFCE